MCTFAICLLSLMIDCSFSLSFRSRQLWAKKVYDRPWKLLQTHSDNSWQPTQSCAQGIRQFPSLSLPSEHRREVRNWQTRWRLTAEALPLTWSHPLWLASLLETCLVLAAQTTFTLAEFLIVWTQFKYVPLALFKYAFSLISPEKPPVSLRVYCYFIFF